MAPAKPLMFTGTIVIAAAVAVALVLFINGIVPAEEVALRLDIMAAIIGAGLTLTGMVLSDLRQLFWQNAREIVRKEHRNSDPERTA